MTDSHTTKATKNCVTYLPGHAANPVGIVQDEEDGIKDPVDEAAVAGHQLERVVPCGRELGHEPVAMENLFGLSTNRYRLRQFFSQCSECIFFNISIYFKVKYFITYASSLSMVLSSK
jgi:hypothetical protein